MQCKDVWKSWGGVQALKELGKYELALQSDYAKEEPGGDLVGNYRASSILVLFAFCCFWCCSL